MPDPHTSACVETRPVLNASVGLYYRARFWCYRSEAAITALLSRGSEGACAFCILGNANAIGKIYKCELGILFLLVKSPFQLRHLSQNQ